MKRLKWIYIKKFGCWTVKGLLHPTIKITETEHYYELYYSGRMDVKVSFAKSKYGFKTCKKVAQLIHNG